LLESTTGTSGRAVHGQTNVFVAVWNRSFDRIAERNVLPSLRELLIDLRATVMSLFTIPTQEVIQILRICFATPEDGFESLPTLLSTDGHMPHQKLNRCSIRHRKGMFQLDRLTMDDATQYFRCFEHS
jgi:hypothetical protein